jgi:hypothetical protein
MDPVRPQRDLPPSGEENIGQMAEGSGIGGSLQLLPESVGPSAQPVESSHSLFEKSRGDEEPCCGADPFLSLPRDAKGVEERRGRLPADSLDPDRVGLEAARGGEDPPSPILRICQSQPPFPTVRGKERGDIHRGTPGDGAEEGAPRVRHRSSLIFPFGYGLAPAYGNSARTPCPT